MRLCGCSHPALSGCWGINARRQSAVATAAALVFGLTSCETTQHQFAQPAPDWQTKSGQLQYRGPKTTLIGDVLVRFSKTGDFQMTFSKSAGVTLVSLQQDANFARIEGPLARGSWLGPSEKAPSRLRGWLGLRKLLIESKKPTIIQTVGPETFIFEF
jgi:hypothetical protein